MMDDFPYRILRLEQVPPALLVTMTLHACTDQPRPSGADRTVSPDSSAISANHPTPTVESEERNAETTCSLENGSYRLPEGRCRCLGGYIWATPSLTDYRCQTDPHDTCGPSIREE